MPQALVLAWTLEEAGMELVEVGSSEDVELVREVLLALSWTE